MRPTPLPSSNRNHLARPVRFSSVAAAQQTALRAAKKKISASLQMDMDDDDIDLDSWCAARPREGVHAQDPPPRRSARVPASLRPEANRRLPCRARRETGKKKKKRGLGAKAV